MHSLTAQILRFVPYGACGLQQQAKMHFKEPLIMRLFGHVFAVLCEPITYYSICEQACQYFWHISAFYQRFRIVRIFFHASSEKISRYIHSALLSHPSVLMHSGVRRINVISLNLSFRMRQEILKGFFVAFAHQTDHIITLLPSSE